MFKRDVIHFLHKCLKEVFLSVWVGAFNFTYIISSNICKKNGMNVSNDEGHNYANKKTNSESFSD